MEQEQVTDNTKFSFDSFKELVLSDYRLANESREASLMGRREVLTGKAKFGIFGDGKEVAQLAMARAFKPGDFRAGYYRDQTFMMASGLLSIQEFFAQLYAHPDVKAEPSSAGRSMNGHYSTRFLDEQGNWKDLTQSKNSSSDISPTAGQMPRLLGMAQASYFFRNNPELSTTDFKNFSKQGNEVAFGTIGDASTSEGLFWETINAAGVLQVPMLISVWDDGHGISVPKKYQTTKESISEILKGFQRDEQGNGFEIFRVKGWNYPELMETYQKAADLCRDKHIPVLVHVEEMTQPQGHSTSGSHERYKSKERLQWEADFDCIKKMREWIISSATANEEELVAIEEQSKKTARDAKNQAWQAFNSPIKKELQEVIQYIEALAKESINAAFVNKIKDELLTVIDPVRRDILEHCKRILRCVRNENLSTKNALITYLKNSKIENAERYNSYLHSESASAISHVKSLAPTYDTEEKLVDGREVLRDNFDAILNKYKSVVIFGEDAGKIGGVNQGLEGLQKKYGEIRVFDTGIREATILGQAIGLALRGLRPIAEIQYLDYLLYAVQIMSDDLATLQYRTKGGQKAPVIVRTRGHRFEGIWHSGSPMGMIINSLRGIHVCVPRNMTQAAGFYNALLACDEPAVVIEPLMAYRMKEKMPANHGEYKLALGMPEILRQGSDVTVITYGYNCYLAMEAAKMLEEVGVSIEVIDVQTLLPFDVHSSLVESIKKTSRVIFFDEDVSGGATGFMMQKVLEEQGAYQYLDAAPKTLSAKDHRPPYGSDGNYFSKPSADDLFDTVYSLMRETAPNKFPEIY
jgi:pyruvate/2-oxoglutarate/acetoin dehydrogenase E1 component/TPP-dependent pyruvate/acetoin dehydrogenase alpha subunit